MYERLIRPVGLVIIERVLTGLAVERDQSLAVLSEQRFECSVRAGEIEHVPDEASPDPFMRDDRRIRRFMERRLILFGIIFTFRICLMQCRPAVHAVFADTDRDLRIHGMEPVEEMLKLSQFAVIPAVVQVICLHVGHTVQRAVVADCIFVRRSRDRVGLEFFHDIVQLLDPVAHSQRLAHDGDLVLHAPEYDGRMMAVLRQQLAHLCLRVPHDALVAVRHGQHRDLRPHEQPHTVADVISVLIMRIMTETYRIRADLTDDREILVQLLIGLRRAASFTVLMSRNTIDPDMLPVQEESVIRRHLRFAEANLHYADVLYLSCRYEFGPYRVQIRIRKSVPQDRIRYFQLQIAALGLAFRDSPAGGVIYFTADTVPADRLGLGLNGAIGESVDHKAIRTVPADVKMVLRQADQLGLAVDSAVFCKIAAHRADIVIDRIVRENSQYILPVLCRRCQINAESCMSAAVLTDRKAVQEDLAQPENASERHKILPVLPRMIQHERFLIEFRQSLRRLIFVPDIRQIHVRPFRMLRDPVQSVPDRGRSRRHPRIPVNDCSFRIITGSEFPSFTDICNKSHKVFLLYKTIMPL